MKRPIMPMTCGIAVASMCAAGFSHWWSVRELEAAFRANAPAAVLPTLNSQVVRHPAAVTPMVEPNPVLANTNPTPPSAEQQKFYDSLIHRMESLHIQNRDLLDQLAETNRDLMKLEFRVDSHSASFRPLPVNEEQPYTSLDSDIGVLPPRAEPVVGVEH
jgi:hypothetical protein